MYSIDITLKYSPIPVSVQRKDTEGAEAVYQQVTQAMVAPTPQLLELTCEKQTDKKVAIFSDTIAAVIISQKDGSGIAGRAPGFFATLQES